MSESYVSNLLKGRYGAREKKFTSAEAAVWARKIEMLRARTKDAGPTLNVLQLPTPKVN